MIWKEVTVGWYELFYIKLPERNEKKSSVWMGSFWGKIWSQDLHAHLESHTLDQNTWYDLMEEFITLI